MRARRRSPERAHEAGARAVNVRSVPAVTAGLLAVTLMTTPARSASRAHGDGGGAVELVCEAVYLPARSTWTRSVRIVYDGRRVRSVQVDGVPVYAFNVAGTVLLTAIDNERIQIDVAARTWTSDFRGQATAQGRCERQPPPAAGPAATP